MTINTTFAVAANGNITGAAFVPGTDARFTTLELHQWLQDLADDSSPTGDDNVSILGSNPSELAGKRNASRPMALTLLNGINIDDAAAKWFKFGSIEQQAGAVLYTGLKVLGSLVASSPIYIIQNAAKVTKYWSDADSANFQILLKAKAGGVLIDSGNATVYSRKYGQTYSHFDVNLAAGGEQSAALSTALDTNINVATMTPAIAAGYFATAIGGTGGVSPKIAITYGDTTQDLGGGQGSLLHKGTITLDGSVALSDVYQALMWATSESSTVTFNGVPGFRYRVLPGQAYPENGPAPFGSFAGGKWFVAQGWWLTGVQAGDSKNYQLISHIGTTETPPTSISIQVAGVVAGDYVLVARDNGSGGFVQDTTLASLASAGATSVTLTAAPTDTPTAPGSQACYIRINGNRHTYTARSGNVISGLSPAVPVGNYAAGLPVFIPFIDAAATGTSIQSANFQYGSSFTCRYRVRKGTTPSIVPFESTLSVTSNGGSGTAVRNADE